MLAVRREQSRSARFVALAVFGLFGGDDSWWRPGFFALAVFSFGIGGTLAGHRTARSRLPWFALPVYAISATVVIYVFLSICVTSESLADVAGSSNTYFLVTQKNIWGETGVWLYQTIGSQSLIALVERIIRFVALFGSLLIWLAIGAAVYFRVTGARFVRPQARRRILIGSLLSYALAALPSLFLGKYIAFDVASTDNLNERIVDNGAYLYPLFLLQPVNMIAVAHGLAVPRFRNIAVGAGGKVRLDLHRRRFPTSPERREILPKNELLLRWTALQIGAVAALAFGMRILLRRLPPGSVRDRDIAA